MMLLKHVSFPVAIHVCIFVKFHHFILLYNCAAKNVGVIFALGAYRQLGLAGINFSPTCS